MVRIGRIRELSLDSFVFASPRELPPARRGQGIGYLITSAVEECVKHDTVPIADACHGEGGARRGPDAIHGEEVGVALVSVRVGRLVSGIDMPLIR